MGEFGCMKDMVYSTLKVEGGILSGSITGVEPNTLLGIKSGGIQIDSTAGTPQGVGISSADFVNIIAQDDLALTSTAGAVNITTTNVNITDISSVIGTIPIINSSHLYLLIADATTTLLPGTSDPVAADGLDYGGHVPTPAQRARLDAAVTALELAANAAVALLAAGATDAEKQRAYSEAYYIFLTTDGLFNVGTIARQQLTYVPRVANHAFQLVGDLVVGANAPSDTTGTRTDGAAAGALIPSAGGPAQLGNISCNGTLKVGTAATGAQIQTMGIIDVTDCVFNGDIISNTVPSLFGHATNHNAVHEALGYTMEVGININQHYTGDAVTIVNLPLANVGDVVIFIQGIALGAFGPDNKTISWKCAPGNAFAVGSMVISTDTSTLVFEKNIDANHNTLVYSPSGSINNIFNVGSLLYFTCLEPNKWHFSQAMGTNTLGNEGTYAFSTT